ncbi:hypothetical protein KAS50_06120, partial [bacterium]|nr:hypothetical protein [bacterium]
MDEKSRQSYTWIDCNIDFYYKYEVTSSTAGANACPAFAGAVRPVLRELSYLSLRGDSVSFSTTKQSIEI